MTSASASRTPNTQSEAPAPGGASETAEGSPSSDSPHWRRRPATKEELRADAIIAVGLFCCAVLSLVFYQALGVIEDPAGPITSALCLVAVTVPLAWRRRAPEAVALLVSAAVIVLAELAVAEQLIMNVSLFLALYTLGAWAGPRRRARVTRWVVIAAMAGWLLSGFIRISLDPAFDSDEALAPGAMTPALGYVLYQLLVNVLFFAAAVWFGHKSWESARDRATLEERAEQLRAERAVVAEQAAALERMHIARELHDSVAHHVSLMGIQTAAARTVLERDPQKARKSIGLVEDSARRAVSDLQSLLGVLRTQPGQPAEFGGSGEPSSLGAAQIADLVAEARAAGMSASYEQFGTPRPLSGLTSLSLYRIAQEALTNTRKHAGPGAHVDVRLRYRASSVELEVTDDGGDSPRRPSSRSRSGAYAPATPHSSGSAAEGTPLASGGHGLMGMRERVATVGGTLVAEPLPGRGFLVRAEIQLPEIQLPDSEAQAETKPESDTMGRKRRSGKDDPAVNSLVGDHPETELEGPAHESANSTPAHTDDSRLGGGDR